MYGKIGLIFRTPAMDPGKDARLQIARNLVQHAYMYYALSEIGCAMSAVNYWFGMAQLGNCQVDPYFCPEACLFLRI
jgi:hypothetical protein